MMRWISAVLVLGVAAGMVCAADATKPPKKENPVLKPVTDDPKLPRVMLIGDSISIGYTLPVRELLKGKANVHRPPANCGDTARGLKSMDVWLGEGKWDAIHFNFGLHDLKYLDDKGNLAAPDKGKQVASVEQYEQNLRKIVERLKKSGARIIWATTTPVPEGSSGRVKDDEIKYNAAAAKVMKENGVLIDDLHAVVVKNPALQQPRNVHFTPEGSKTLARTVADCIEAALKP